MVNGLVDGMFLYHGSYCKVEKPDLRRCALYKDFGKGFYLTSDKAQAVSFSKISTAKAKKNGIVSSESEFGMVSVFSLKNTDELNVLLYETADIKWLRNIVEHRILKDGIHLERDEKYDVIAGKIANDNTNATLLAYMSGLYGETGSAEAENICISLLLPERLKDQYCFRSERSLSCLVYEGVEEVCLKK